MRENISDEDLLKKVQDKFHGIEYKLDNMANKDEVDLNEILEEAKKSLLSVFRNAQGNSSWVGENWKYIEKDIKHNLRSLEK